ncbi:hypothetical protein [Leifsonia sp. Root112D2]|uniref:hypothetical protein n=1 Tax=Leifsonia sp. Root112D2 TaxID=1736426 RepID=UPI0006FC37A4|nr:hypothetical protein [Leifsonia sp. Root112D2]
MNEPVGILFRTSQERRLLPLDSWQHLRKVLDVDCNFLEFSRPSGRVLPALRVVMARILENWEFHAELDTLDDEASLAIEGRLPPDVGAVIAALETIFTRQYPAAPAMVGAEPFEVRASSLRAGRLLVRTESGSSYLIDMDAGYLQRVRGTDPSPDPEVAPASSLRRDGESLKVLRVHQLRVGCRAIIDVEPLGDPRRVSFTRRTTTIVTGIEPWPDET